MSRSLAKFLSACVVTVTTPLSKRQQRRTIARVVDNLNTNEVSIVQSRLGEFKLQSLKSAYAASVYERFHTDEPETLAYIEGFKPGDIFWDIGANIGIYSIYAALKNNVTTFAFEPSGFNYGLLVEHIALNNMSDRVSTFCLAFGDKTGCTSLHMRNTDIGHAGNSLNEVHLRDADATFKQATICYRIDDFIRQFALPVPHHIKLDVDGVEPWILAGAGNTLPQVKTLLIEVEHENADKAESLIEPPLHQAGFAEDMTVRNSGSGRNRLFINKNTDPLPV